MQTRRDFLKTGMLSTAGLALAGMGVPIRSFARTLGANDRIRVGVIGFSDRFRSSLLPTFMANAKELNFEIVAVSDIWKLRREEAVKHFKEKYNLDEIWVYDPATMYEQGSGEIMEMEAGVMRPYFSAVDSYHDQRVSLTEIPSCVRASLSVGAALVSTDPDPVPP